MKLRVAVIGVGLMGGWLARHLLAAGAASAGMAATGAQAQRRGQQPTRSPLQKSKAKWQSLGM